MEVKDPALEIREIIDAGKKGTQLTTEQIEKIESFIEQ